MKKISGLIAAGFATLAAVALVVALSLATGLASQQATTPPTPPRDVVAREGAYRANNIGVTRLEQFDFEAAVAAFRQALAADPALAMARVNLGIALFYSGDADGARRELTAVRSAVPERPHPDYVIGLIQRAANETQAAVASFQRVLALDPSDVGAAINLGQLYTQERRFPESIELLRRALAAEPYNATAAYGLATALLRGGSDAEGQEAMTRFERLRESAYAVTYAQTYLGQGRYAEAISSTGAEPGLVDPATPAVTFTDGASMFARAGSPGPGSPDQAAPPSGATTPAPATPGAATPGAAAPDAAAGTVTLFDLDNDTDLDLAESTAAGLKIYRNDAGQFTDVTSPLLGAIAAGPATAVVAGDFDNDGYPDLVLLRSGGVALLRRDPAAGFTDVTAVAGLGATAGPRSAAWLDADHDGDLDLLVASLATTDVAASTTRLFRNNGNGSFTDVTADAGLVLSRQVLAVVPTDYDNRRDIDLLLVAGTGAPLLFRNLRDGSFRDVAVEVGLRSDDGAVMAAVGDVNKDGYPDLFIARAGGPGAMALSDGLGRFTISAAPPETADARAAQFVDYDSDGLLDLFVLTAQGPRLLRNIGSSWTDVTARAIPAAMSSALASAATLATGDLDQDGHVDFVSRTASGLVVWRNSGNDARSLRVSLTVRVSPRTPAGAKVEMRAGSLQQRHELYAATPAPAPADVIFGLGDRVGADVVRVLWPSGILQAETSADPSAAPLVGSIAIEELDRKPSSCPFLFTWNGERFEFVTDFLGGGEMGAWLAPGVRNTPDPDEYVRISGDRLKPRDGRYELRVTNELEEALFLDRVQLLAVAHPADVEVHPNEGLGGPARPFTIYTTKDARPPLAAVDDQGNDVLDRISRIDRTYPDAFKLERVRGYAAEHTLALTLPPPGPNGRRLLLLTGWTDYAFSGDNVAAHQAGLPALMPSLEVEGPDGVWRPALESIGMPVGRPQTVVVDLTGSIPASAREVRIRTSMRIWWDQVLVDTSDGRAAHTVSRIEPATAMLDWRGYSALTTPDGREPYGYDYERVSAESPWKLMPGRYTREGDVRELLTRTDDMFVVSRSGDQVSLSFDASALPVLPDGWTRTFLLYTGGFSKEMNLHSSSPDQLLPLPFHGMTRYPYTAPEAYPSTPAHRAYQERYNTRVVPRVLPALESGVDWSAPR